MLSTSDIKKLIEALREVFATKEDLAEFKEEMMENFSNLQTTVDGFAKTVNRHDKEILVMNHRLDKLEKTE